VTESNLARSLFSNQKGQTSRRKVVLPLSETVNHAPNQASDLNPKIDFDLANQTLDRALEVPVAAQPDLDIQQLRQEVAELRQYSAMIESELEIKTATIEQFEAKINRLNQTHTATVDTLKSTQTELMSELEKASQALAENHNTIGQFQSQLTEASIQRESLEAEIIKHLSAQAMLQHSMQDMNSNRANSQGRFQDLEQQIAELQEQVLKQAGQAAEYEAAIQHWKDQSVHHQRHAVQLSGALERLLEEKDIRRAKLESSRSEEAIPVAKELSVVAPNSNSNGNGNSKNSPRPIDLPSFLSRQR